MGPGAVDFEGGTLSMLAGSLGLILDRPVIDKTGVADYFEIHLKFSPDDFAPPAPFPSDPGAPGIFRAFLEQLGLTLAPSKGPVDVLAIETGAVDRILPLGAIAPEVVRLCH